MKRPPLTYGEMFDRLRSLGFEERTFEHPSGPATRIDLPDGPPDRVAKSMYLGAVLGILKFHGFVSEIDLLRNPPWAE